MKSRNAGSYRLLVFLVFGGSFACSGETGDLPAGSEFGDSLASGGGGGATTRSSDQGGQGSMPVHDAPATGGSPDMASDPAASGGSQPPAMGGAAPGGAPAEDSGGTGGVPADDMNAMGGADNAGGQATDDSDDEGPDDPKGFGPTSCLPEFEQVCGPNINFDNRDPASSGNFDAVIADVESTMKWAACTVCSILYRSADEVPRPHDTINFIIDDHDGVAYAGGNSIHLSTRHIQNYDNPDSALVEFRGVMVHEAVHLYQLNGGASDGALIEGIADFVRIRVGLYGPGRRRQGGNWDGAYTTSGFFFSWLAGPCEYHDDHHPQSDLDIGYRINQLMSEGQGAIRNEIESTFEADINALWNQYQDSI